MVDRVASFITKYQLKRVALLVFMMWLTKDVYAFVMAQIAAGSMTEWQAAALLTPLSVLFPATMNYMKESS